MPLPTRILVPTDFSEPAAVAQEYASALASALGARLHVLHVISDRPMGDDLDAREVPELLERTEREVRQRLEAWRSSGDRHRMEVVADVARGVPDATILQYADAHGVDLIVIGWCGHGGTRLPRLGHVAVSVLQGAGRPVLALTAGSAQPPDSRPRATEIGTAAPARKGAGP